MRRRRLHRRHHDRGIPDFALKDEAFFSMTWAKQPEVQVLATAKIDGTPSAVKAGHAGESVPQMWTYQRTMFGGQEFRAFVRMQGHTCANLAHQYVPSMILRVIARHARAQSARSPRR